MYYKRKIDKYLDEWLLRKDKSPALVVGIHVALVNSRLTFVTPSALFQEKLSPGIFVLLIFYCSTFIIIFQKLTGRYTFSRLADDSNIGAMSSGE